jgi:hypothetical protein
MTVDVAAHQGVAVQESQTQLAAATADLVSWAESARAAHAVATSLVSTSFVPEAFRGKANEATADIIQGTAAPRAITLRAIVQSAGHRIWTEESTDARAVVCGQRRGEERVERSVWTLARAQKLKLTGKANWQNQPQAMLLARATSECARLVAADAVLGVPYSSEELADADPTPTTTVSRAPGEKRTARRAAPPAPPEPDLDELAPAADDADTAESITEAQNKKLHAALNDGGYADRDSGLTFISETLGRPVESSKNLSKDEASRVIDVLERGVPIEDPPEPPTWPDVPDIPS